LYFSNSQDVRNFLQTLNLDRDNYQIGESKVFLRECEKLKLDYRLHQQIMASIVTIQRWFRTLLQRRQFLRITWATETLQVLNFILFVCLQNINYYFLVLVENDISSKVSK